MLRTNTIIKKDVHPRVTSNQLANEYMDALFKAETYQKAADKIEKFLKPNKSFYNMVLLCTILYFGLLGCDLAYMAPMLKSVVLNGFQLEEQYYYYFVALYGLMAVLLSTVFAYGFAYLIEDKFLEFDIQDAIMDEKEEYSQPVEQYVDDFTNRESNNRNVAIGAGILFVLIAGSIALFRNWITNAYAIEFASIVDIINLILPIGIVLLLLYLGAYKVYILKFLSHYKSLKNLRKSEAAESKRAKDTKSLCIGHELKAFSVGNPPIGRNQNLDNVMKEFDLNTP